MALRQREQTDAKNLVLSGHSHSGSVLVSGATDFGIAADKVRLEALNAFVEVWRVQPVTCSCK